MSMVLTKKPLGWINIFKKSSIYFMWLVVSGDFMLEDWIYIEIILGLNSKTNLLENQ
jgi:hypothetical protein